MYNNHRNVTIKVYKRLAPIFYLVIMNMIVDPGSNAREEKAHRDSVVETELIPVSKKLDRPYRSEKSQSWLNAAPAMISGAELTKRLMQKHTLPQGQSAQARAVEHVNRKLPLLEGRDVVILLSRLVYPKK